MNKKVVLPIVIGVLLLGIIATGVYFVVRTPQSILSQSSINVGQDGKVYWVTTAVANSGSTENFIFNPSKYVFTDGSGKEVTPTDTPLIVRVSKSENYCKYTTTENDYRNPLFQKKYYYTLNNPEKIALVDISDGNGNSETLDGSTVSEISITDSDGKGEVRIQTQGLLSDKYNCPNYENVIYFKDDADAGNIIFYDRASFERNILDKDINTQFTSTLEDVEITNNNIVRGYINFGNVVYTITADQDYFDSTTYIPPKSAEPDITDVDSPSELSPGTTNTIVVYLKNKVSGSGEVIISRNGGDFDLSPNSKKISLSGSASTSVSFTITSPSSLGSKTLKIQACGSSQFTSDVKCDTYSKTINVVSKEPTEKCGDNICQSYETSLTCPKDCESKKPIPEGECPIGETYREEQPDRLLGLIPGRPAGCYISAWVYLVITGFIFALIVTMIILVSRRRNA